MWTRNHGETKIPFGWELIPVNVGRLRKDIDIYCDNHPHPKCNNIGNFPPRGWHWVGEGLDGMRGSGNEARWIGTVKAREKMTRAEELASLDCVGADSCRYYIKTHENKA